VEPLGVRHEQALHDAADRCLGRSQQQMKMVAHQAVAIELERLARLQVGNHLEKGAVIGLLVEDVLAVVATIDDVVHEAFVDQSQRPWHGRNLSLAVGRVKKIVLTLFSAMHTARGVTNGCACATRRTSFRCRNVPVLGRRK